MPENDNTRPLTELVDTGNVVLDDFTIHQQQAILTKAQAKLRALAECCPAGSYEQLGLRSLARNWGPLQQDLLDFSTGDRRANCAPFVRVFIDRLVLDLADMVGALEEPKQTTVLEQARFALAHFGWKR